MSSGSAPRTATTPSVSVLFDRTGHRSDGAEPPEPDFFADLHLGQIVESITVGRQEYNLAPFFHTPLPTVESITYRHEVFRDLEKPALRECIARFAEGLRHMRDHLTQASRLHYGHQRDSWYLAGVGVYVDAVESLAEDLGRLDIEAVGLLAFRAALRAYSSSDAFAALSTETRQLKTALAEVRYCLHVAPGRIRVSRYEGEIDYSAEITATFERFKSGAVRNYLVTFPNWPDMDHVEAGVLDLVARLYPETFAALNSFPVRYSDYLDPTIATFDREVQFYLAYREFMAPLESAGLTFCFPQLSPRSKEVLGRSTFDLALGSKLVAEGSPVVCNDFRLLGPERILVVSGPNQGGKTTFARTFGQLHYLASLGLPVPGSEARLFLCDRIFTHFERKENLEDLHGKLQDDLLRIHEILARATSRSILIMNEIFTSTVLDDAVFLATKVLEQLIQLDLLCVCVTFVDELASLGEATVSMVSAVVPDDPSVRTYKIERRPADGISHAVAIAEKYELTYDALGKRLTS